MTDRRYARERLSGELSEVSREKPVQFRGVRVPNWFEAKLSHPDWPAERAVSVEMAVEVTIAVDPDTGPVLTGVRSQRGSTLPYREASALLTATIDTDSLLQGLAAKAAGAFAARQFSTVFVGDAAEETPLADLDQGGVGRLVEFRDAAERAAYPTTRPQRRRHITRDLLKEVASVYRRAHADGHPPTVAVSEHFNTSHRNAARWVAEARKSGELGAADGPRPGEFDDAATPPE